MTVRRRARADAEAELVAALAERAAVMRWLLDRATDFDEDDEEEAFAACAILVLAERIGMGEHVAPGNRPN